MVSSGSMEEEVKEAILSTSSIDTPSRYSIVSIFLVVNSPVLGGRGDKGKGEMYTCVSEYRLHQWNVKH